MNGICTVIALLGRALQFEIYVSVVLSTYCLVLLVVIWHDKNLELRDEGSKSALKRVPVLKSISEANYIKFYENHTGIKRSYINSSVSEARIKQRYQHIQTISLGTLQKIHLFGCFHF